MCFICFGICYYFFDKCWKIYVLINIVNGLIKRNGIYYFEVIVKNDNLLVLVSIK